MSRVNALTQKYDPNSSDVLFRALFYDCRPYGNKEHRPGGIEVDFSQKTAFSAATWFQKDLKQVNQVALRLGDL